MKVSVILPTYRRDEDLRRALHSLAVQDFSDFEVIVVDDNVDMAWNQKVQQMISDLRVDHPAFNIQYFQNDTQMGSAQARNRGVSMASGEYITFLDDDDEYLQGKIKRQYEFMVDNQLDYSITDLHLYYENGKIAELRSRKYIKNTDKASLLKYHLMYHLTGTDVIMLTKAYFDLIGGFPPIDVGDEYYLISRAIDNDGKFGYLPGCDIRAYVHTGEGGLSSGKSKIAGENRLYEYKKKYFPLMEAKDIRYIRMRHYAVLCYAGVRMHNYFYFLIYGILTFFSAPIQCITLVTGRKKKSVAEKIVVMSRR